ncbi:MAG: hypothetical protein IJQ85_03355 [Selenomonadaceae bacterium]|nr:hypothetical protein [Selenomonadaceae bacterium]
MRAVNFLSAVAALIILATSASGECESENIPVEVQTESETRPIKRTVAEFAEMAQGDYTGLVIDCRGLGLKTAMSPVVKNANGTKIYGHKNLDVDKMISMGMVDYVNDPEKISRAGKNPLVVKAIALDNFNCDPVVSIEDSNRILIENYVTKFLKDLNVVFLFD